MMAPTFAILPPTWALSGQLGASKRSKWGQLIVTWPNLVLLRPHWAQLGPNLESRAPHCSRKHIFDFQHFSYRCKCPHFMLCSQHRPLSSCFDRHMGLSSFALSSVTSAQLSSWARTANSHGNIGCAFYASTAAQNTPEQVKEALIQRKASQMQPRSA